MAKVLDTRPGSPTIGLMIEESEFNKPVGGTTTQPPAQPPTTQPPTTQPPTTQPPSTGGTMSTSSFDSAFYQQYGRYPSSSETNQWSNAGRPSNFSSLFGGTSSTPSQTPSSGMTEEQRGQVGQLVEYYGKAFYDEAGFRRAFQGAWGTSPTTEQTSYFKTSVGLETPKTETPTETTPQTPTLNVDLQFRAGLTDAQKKSITNMLLNRAGTPLNETDAKNLAYALNETDWGQYQGKTSEQLGLTSSKIQQAESAPEQEFVGESWEVPALGKLPQDILDMPEWQALNDDQKTLIQTYYNLTASKSLEQRVAFESALKEAVKVVDPYIRQQIYMVEDEIDRSIGKVEGDYQSNMQKYQDRIQQTQEDLINSRDYMTAEQQADLANQLKQYKRNLYTTQQMAAESGLAFSSPRDKAEEELKTDYSGSVESTQRKYNKSMRDLQVSSERQTRDLQQGVADLERGKKETMTDIQRQAEKTLGSKTAPGVSGVSPLGGITGTLEEAKGKYVTGWVNELLNNPLTGNL